MANPDRGEVDLKAGDTLYVLRFCTNSMRHLENVLDRSTPEIMEAFKEPQKARLGLMQNIMWAGLLDRHPGITLEQAGDVMDEAGHEAAGAAIGEALTLWLPAPSGAKKENPRKAS